MEIITGRTGEQHVRARDDGELNQLFLGNGDFVLSTGQQFAAEIAPQAKVRVYDGTVIMQGRQAKIRPSTGSELIEFDATVAGMRRADYIVAEYSQDNEAYEQVVLKAVAGTPSATSYILPSLQQGNIDNGQTHQMPLWEVRFDGHNISGLFKKFTVLNTTPIQTALDTANAAKSQITADLNSFKQTLSADMIRYQDVVDADIASHKSSVYARLDALAGVVRVAPLMTVVAHNLITQVKTIYSKDFDLGQYTRTWSISGLNYHNGEEIVGTYTDSNRGTDTVIDTVWGVYGTASTDVATYDGQNSFEIDEFQRYADRITRITIERGIEVRVPATGYTYENTDVFVLYLNGLKVPVDRYEVEAIGSDLSVTSNMFTIGTLYNDIEIEIWRPEEA